ncbi:hypothetical protein SPRG_16537 [Saprolegnia parasitica CBS 223.65]|uniref:Uncharacterized protein n=1 Tax=Saprolegnia parasitica (strain CBS 223.65) TaxID=695850 RepID=A0A067BTY3_SAPPC|nr:hypothetical protein SPRG_16537 [Saprolegnia parasitica CBS 223.65]KDO18097.1 hypothetical protein SPRG_16537 [Saprolegnia parasitica CBS 223.65]|eukprot:XP_012211194.1 hypothetical protein SPRG_16537 [Saprolegnia parasitica CBS 223.65]
MCLFHQCDLPPLPGTTKCERHKHRTPCAVPGCANQAYARSRCVRHGGQTSCLQDGCNANARAHGYCAKHLSTDHKSLCTEPGCGSFARTKGRCVRHGGGRPCSVCGCKSHARSGGYCHRHAAQRTMAPTPSPKRPSRSTRMHCESMEIVDDDAWMDDSILELILAVATFVHPAPPTSIEI